MVDVWVGWPVDSTAAWLADNSESLCGVNWLAAGWVD